MITEILITEILKNTLLNNGFIFFLKDKGMYKVLRNFKVKVGEKEQEFLTGEYVLFGENTIVDVFHIEMITVPINTNEVEIKEYV